jgi:ribose 5-phosphate isomerase A
VKKSSFSTSLKGRGRESGPASDAALGALGRYAIRYVKPGQTIGLGTGHAASAFIRAIGESGMKVRGVPTSNGSAELARQCGLEIVSLAEVKALDADYDGADEVDSRFNLLKGFGGALVREKIVAASSKKFIVLVGPEKLYPHLGARKRLPVEVVPFGVPFVTRVLAKLGMKAAPRRNADGTEFISDNGNPILDCVVGDIRNPARLERELLAIPGVLGTGIFVGMATTVLVASEDGKPRIIKAKS